ncbi:MAG: copper chaperone PCu(A)C [Steroidobacteraceae bacterium]
MNAVLSACLVIVAPLMGSSALGAEQDLTVSKAWIRFIMPSAPAAAYFRLSNPSAKQRVLVGADSPACGRLTLHESLIENGMDRMVMLESVRVPAHGHVDFTPGHYHLMCMAPSKEMILGRRVPITLRFAGGEKITAPFTVRGASG